MNLKHLLFLTIVVISSCSDKEDVFYSKIDSPHYISEDLNFDEGQDFIVEAGAELIIADSVNIEIKGDLIMIGTIDDTIFMNPENPEIGWGQFSLTGESVNLTMEYVSVTDGNFFSFNTNNKIRNCTFKNTQELDWETATVRFIFGEVEVIDSYFEGVNKAEGVLVHDVNFAMVGRNTFFKVPDAIEFINCREGKIFNNAMTDGADDAIDLNGCIDIIIEDNSINNYDDAGIEIGDESFGRTLGTQFINNTISHCSKGIWLKEASFVHAIDCSFQENDIAVDVISPEVGAFSFAIVESCDMITNGEDIRKDDRSEVEVIN